MPVQRFVAVDCQVVRPRHRHVVAVRLDAIEGRRGQFAEYCRRRRRRLGLIRLLRTEVLVNGFFHDLVDGLRVMQFSDVHRNRYDHPIVSENKKT